MFKAFVKDLKIKIIYKFYVKKLFFKLLMG